MEDTMGAKINDDVAEGAGADVGLTPGEGGESEVERGRRGPLIGLVAGILVILAGGAMAFMAVTKTGLFSVASIPGEEISSEALWTVEDYPRVDASTATHPLAMAFYQNFTGDKDKKYADFGFTQTHQAYVGLIDGKKDVILVTSPSEDELKLAADKGMELEVTPVVKEGFVFFVAANNPVESLTSAQVRDIYAGKIKNWKEVGGKDEAIVAYQRQVNSGSQTGMLDLVMKGVPMMTPPSESWQISSMEEIVDVVSSYDGASGAIGYSYYYYATTMYRDIDKDVADGIKLVKIDDVAPEEETIRSGEYPFTTAYYAVIDKAAAAAAPARKLLNEMLSARGQAVARSAQYVYVK